MMSARGYSWFTQERPAEVQVHSEHRLPVLGFKGFFLVNKARSGCNGIIVPTSATAREVIAVAKQVNAYHKHRHAKVQHVVMRITNRLDDESGRSLRFHYLSHHDIRRTFR